MEKSVYRIIDANFNRGREAARLVEEFCRFALNNPQLKDSWERIQKSIELLPKIPSRTVIRITCVKGKNMGNAKEYAELVKKGKPDFVEVKAYMHVGFSQYRLPAEAMPNMKEIREFAGKIAKRLGYDVRDEDEESLVVLLSSPKWREKSTIIDFEKLFAG